jgi:hypothetical protein
VGDGADLPDEQTVWTIWTDEENGREADAGRIADEVEEGVCKLI